MDSLPKPKNPSNPFSAISDFDRVIAPHRVEELRTAAKNREVDFALRTTLRRLGLKFPKSPREFFEELMAGIQELPDD
jgi:hypothetical protein